MANDWPGPPAPDNRGNIDVAGFNEFLKDHPNLRRSPIRAAIKFVRLKDPRGRTTRIGAEANRMESPDNVRVVLTEDRLPDDSVRAVRHALEFRRTGGARWRLESARRTQRCQQGRGHQGFSARPCV